MKDVGTIKNSSVEGSQTNLNIESVSFTNQTM